MNNTYLNTEKIELIANFCNSELTNTVKNKLTKYSNKFGLKFGADSQINRNMLWKYVSDKLALDTTSYTRTGITFKEASQQSNKFGNASMMREYIQAHIQNNYKEEYNFLLTFNFTNTVDNIAGILKPQGLTLDITFDELLQIDNYNKFFKLKYGIENCNKETLKATNTLINWIETITNGVNNKPALIWAINEYLVNQDASTVHTLLHKN